MYIHHLCRKRCCMAATKLHVLQSTIPSWYVSVMQPNHSLYMLGSFMSTLAKGGSLLPIHTSSHQVRGLWSTSCGSSSLLAVTRRAAMLLKCHHCRVNVERKCRPSAMEWGLCTGSKGRTVRLAGRRSAGNSIQSYVCKAQHSTTWHKSSLYACTGSGRCIVRCADGGGSFEAAAVGLAAVG